ncbi:MAG: transporter related [Clostridia bacterium]|jgi:ATPase subunit of ABC transporter with duplicated ATPase domains|nr:transporter related [Clostridia bacterium]
MLLRVEGLTKYYNIKKIFEKIDFLINEGEKTAIIGVNGVGKSTLLNIVAGADREYEGSIYWQDKDLSIFYGTQELNIPPDTLVLDFVMKSCSIDAEDSEGQGMLLKILKELGLADKDLQKRCCELSGGMQTKLILAAAIYLQPQLLILDEPNNHLDMEQLQQLEEFLKDYKGTLIMVTHDRKLLDNVCTKIIEMSTAGSKTYSGNYTSYTVQKEIELKEQQGKYENYVRERKSLIENIRQRRSWFTAAHDAAGQNDFARARAKKQAKVMKAKERALERLESSKAERPKDVQTVNLSLLGAASEAVILARVEAVGKSYGSHKILQDINLIIRNKERYCLLGENGSGKTTLLNIISGVDSNYSGAVKLNPSASIGYYRQLHENLKLDREILEEIRDTGVSANEARLLLGSFLIRGNDVFKKINQLSIGERSRISILKTILQKPDLLILDEPTNHLDVYTREVFEDALLQYDGAILFVSHDRYFIEKIATKVLRLQENRLVEYPGDYSYYIEKSQGSKTIDTDTENKMRLETELSYVNGRLADPRISPEEKAELEARYFAICRELRYYSKI